ncbi:MAG: CDP-alcohol phosphatidyltransferase family protein [Bacteroidales bacterium]|nr:CDP-alcohol phosphatidyltransferase family protein [Bacteroidales bacterium]
MKKHIPNLLTLLNLACGTAAIVLTLEGQWQYAVYLVLVASLFDFLDGFLARLLNAQSETGKQLDSLADMVTFGVLPSLFIYTIFKNLFFNQGEAGTSPNPILQWIMFGSVLIVPAFSAIRLARFNVRDAGDHFFYGLPTPAHALFWTGLFWQLMQDGLFFGSSLNVFFLWTIMLIMAFHMILPVRMYTLKFEHFRVRGNLVRYVLIVVSVVILLLTGLSGLSLVVLTYILLSLLNLLLQTRVFR